MKKIKLLIVLGASVLLFTACSSDVKQSKVENKTGINVVTTFYPMYEFTQKVVGDEGNVSLMITSGVEPHDYEPTAKDIAKLHDADVFVYNNENMETWVPSVLKEVKKQDVNVIKATEKITLMPGSEEEEAHDYDEKEHHHELDPHVWLAPSLAIKEVETIRDELIKAYPDKTEIFTENATSYLNELSDLDNEFHQSLDNATEKHFVTQHAAFGYLAHEYGLTQVPISGLSPDEEPSPKRIAELKTFVKDNQVSYIYFEDNANDKVAKTLSDEAGVKLEVLNTLEGLSNEKQKNGESYVSVMRDNLTALEKTTKN